MDNGATANGGDDTSGTETFTIVVNPINDAPTVADTTKDYSAQANMPIDIGAPAGLLGDAADSLDTGANPGYTPNLAVQNVSATNTAGGGVAVNVDGSFTFTPPPGVTGNVTFTYDVCDDGDGPPASQCTSVSVTFNVAGPVIWFVDDSVVSGDGTLSAPFATLGEAVTAIGADTNERVFLFAGTYGTGIDLNSSGWLIGQAVTGASFDAVMGITPPAGTVARPAIATGTATVQNTVSLDVSSVVRGIALSTGANAAMTDNAGATTNVTVNEVSITTTTGNGLVLNDLTVAAATTFTITNLSKNGAGDAVNLTGVTGPVSIPVGTIQNTTPNAVRLSGGSGNFTYGGSITNGAGRSVEAANRTSGNVTFSGLVNGTGGTGVSLTTNGTSVMTFSGGLTLSTGANAAFTATGGGNVVVTGAANTITTTTGTALNVANTNIGVGGLVFRSISANGAANGIVLNATGATAGLTVSGTGLAGTGGTIQNGGTGISLTSTQSPSFAWMQLNSFSDFAIRGSSVVNFTLANSVINGVNGNDDAANEGAVRFSQLTGTASITNSNISGSVETNVRVENTSGTLNRLTVDATTIGLTATATGDDGLLVEASGTAVINVTVQNSFFTAARGDWAQLSNVGSGSMDVIFTGNTLTNNHPNTVSGGAVATFTNGAANTATYTYSISNNTFRDSQGASLAFSGGGAAGNNSSGRIQNNTIGVPGIANSGSTAGSGIAWVISGGGGTHTVLIDNNHIHQYNNHGILVQVGDNMGNGITPNATVTNNTVSNPGNINTDFNGFHLNNGVVGTDNHTICLALSGNTLTASGSGTISPNNQEFRLRQRQSTTVRLPGYGGANNNDAAVVAFLQGQNTVTAGNGAASNTVPTGGGFVGGAACTQPVP